MTIDDLSARLEKVERENRRMRAAGVSLLVLLAAVAAMGQAKAEPKVVQAERFEVVGGDGKVTATLGSIRPARGSAIVGPTAALVLYDGAEKPRVLLDVAGDGAAGLVYFDQGRRPRAALLAEADGSPSLHLSDPAGTARASLAVRKGGAPDLTLFDGKGRQRAVLEVRKDDRPSLTLRDEGGRGGATLAVEPGGAEGLSLWNPQTGKPRVALFVDGEASGGVAGVALYDKEAAGRAELLLLKDGAPRLGLSDKDGKDLVALPK